MGAVLEPKTSINMNVKVCSIVGMLIAIAISFVSVAPAQDQDDAYLIESAQDFAVDMVARSKGLPKRWMATQKRELVDTSRIAEGSIATAYYFEFMASDSELEVVYSYLRAGDTMIKSDVAIEGTIEAYVEASVRKDMVVHRLQNEDWKIYPTLPKFSYPTTMPFNWCIGFLNSSSSGIMRGSDLLSLAFWAGGKRSCFTAFKEGKDLVSIWGVVGHPQSLLEITFDTETGLIKEYAAVKPYNEIVTKKEIRQKKYSVLEKGTVQWKAYPGLRPDRKEDLQVPVLVKIVSTMNEGKEVECTVQIDWKFGSDVPESVFEDPRTPKFKQPF